MGLCLLKTNSQNEYFDPSWMFGSCKEIYYNIQAIHQMGKAITK